MAQFSSPWWALLPSKLLLGLDARPQHVLSLDHIWMLLDELPIVRQYKLPASVDPHNSHVLQKVLHILCAELRVGAMVWQTQEAPPQPVPCGCGKGFRSRPRLTLVTAATSFLTTHRLCVNFHI